MKKKLIGLLCILCLAALPIAVFAGGACDNPSTFTVEFIVNEDGITAPQSQTVDYGQNFTLPAIQRQYYRLYWVIQGETARHAAGNSMPFATHNTPENGTLRLTAVFECNRTPEQLRDQFVARINGLITALADYTTYAELSPAIQSIQLQISNWTGIALAGLNNDGLNAQITRRTTLADQEAMAAFVISTNALINALPAMLTLFQMRVAISNIDALIYNWTGLTPVGLQTSDLETQRVRAEGLVAAQGVMVDTAMTIIQDIRASGLSIPYDRVISNATQVDIDIFQGSIASPQRIWGNNTGAAMIRVFVNEADAITSASGTNTNRHGNVTINSTNAFGLWFYTTLVEIGAPESILNDAGTAPRQEFLDQRTGIRNEINRHLNRMYINGFSYYWGNRAMEIHNTHTEPFRMVIQFSNS